jgi:hypothetical protein
MFNKQQGNLSVGGYLDADYVEDFDDRRSTDTTKELMSSFKCRSVEVINNPARPGSNHMEVNCINYK